MATNLLNADTGFPNLEGMADEEKIQQLTDYLYMLLESLRYTLGNLGEENFNDAELENLSKTITDPVYIVLNNQEEKYNSTLTMLAGSLGINISDLQTGQYSKLYQDVNGLTSTVYDPDTGESRINQNAAAITQEVTDRAGAVSALSQTVNGMRLSVSNGEGSSVIQLLANGVSISSKTITFTGMVTFSDLSTSGATVINGGNIQTGTIKAIDIESCDIAASTFKSMLTSNYEIQGRVDFYYQSDTSTKYRAGSLHLKDEADTSNNNPFQLLLETFKWNNNSNMAFALKMRSAGDMSLESSGAVYMRSQSGTLQLASAANVTIGTNVGASGEKWWYFKPDGIYFGTTKVVSAV